MIMTKLPLHGMIEVTVRIWPDWSRAERRRMNAIVEEVLEHCRSGNGNQFIRQWCDQNLAHVFTNHKGE